MDITQWKRGVRALPLPLGPLPAQMLFVSSSSWAPWWIPYGLCVVLQPIMETWCAVTVLPFLTFCFLELIIVACLFFCVSFADCSPSLLLLSKTLFLFIQIVRIFHFPLSKELEVFFLSHFYHLVVSKAVAGFCLKFSSLSSCRCPVTWVISCTSFSPSFFFSW